MRKLVAYLFITLDGVIESPEKWVMYNDAMGEAINTESYAADTLLLGRGTYDVFAASWPQRTVDDDPLADWMNNTPKVVVSSTLDDPTWQHTTVIDMEVAKHIQSLKEESGKNILVSGSPTRVRSLLRDSLLDELRLFVHPILAGPVRDCSARNVHRSRWRSRRRWTTASSTPPTSRRTIDTTRESTALLLVSEVEPLRRILARADSDPGQERTGAVAVPHVYDFCRPDARAYGARVGDPHVRREGPLHQQEDRQHPRVQPAAEDRHREDPVARQVVADGHSPALVDLLRRSGSSQSARGPEHD